MTPMLDAGDAARLQECVAGGGRRGLPDRHRLWRLLRSRQRAGGEAHVRVEGPAGRARLCGHVLRARAGARDPRRAARRGAPRAADSVARPRDGAARQPCPSLHGRLPNGPPNAGPAGAAPTRQPGRARHDRRRSECSRAPTSRESPTRGSLAEVPSSLLDRVDLALDGGELPGTPSTVVDLRDFATERRWHLLREGALSMDEVRELLALAI